MAASVFISFAAKDRDTAEAICAALENRGFECWMASRNVPAGKNFQEYIVRAIRAAKVMIFVFSSNSNNSDEVKKEIALAGQNKLLVIPVRIEDVLPNEAFAYEFATRQWIDYFGDWERALDELSEQIASIADKAPPSDEPPPKPPRRRAKRAGDEPDGDKTSGDAPEFDAAALYVEANRLAADREYDRAIELYDQLLRAKPDHAQAFNNRGAAHLSLGRTDRAVADFDRAVGLQPNLPEAYNNRGNAFQGRGEFDRAIRDYTVALQIRPDFVQALENRARAYERKGLADEARKDRAAAFALGSVGAGPPPPDGRKALIIAGAILGGLLLFALLAGSILKTANPPASDTPAASDAPASDTAPSDAAASSAAPAAQPTDGKNRIVTIINNTDQIMTNVFASSPQTRSWGEDRLSGTLPSGSQINLTISDGTNNCVFDLMAKFANNTQIQMSQINVCQVERESFETSQLTAESASQPAAAPAASN